MANHVAYWIAPNGSIIPVGLRHINLIIDNPKEFGITSQYIKKVHDKHDEIVGTEGNAREEIISDIMKKGFIRIRMNNKSRGWTIQLNQLGNREKEYIWSWADGMTDGKYDNISKYNEVTVMDMNPKILFSSSIEDILSGKMFECADIKKNKTVLLEVVNGKIINSTISDYMYNSFRNFLYSSEGGEWHRQ